MALCYCDNGKAGTFLMPGGQHRFELGIIKQNY